MIAAAMLADRANKTQGADLRGCWPHLQAVHDHLNCQVCGRAKVRDGGGYFVSPDDSDEHREREAALARQAVNLDSSSMGAWPEGDLAYDGVAGAANTRADRTRARRALPGNLPRCPRSAVPARGDHRLLAINDVIDPRKEDDT